MPPWPRESPAMKWHGGSRVENRLAPPPPQFPGHGHGLFTGLPLSRISRGVAGTGHGLAFPAAAAGWVVQRPARLLDLGHPIRRTRPALPMGAPDPCQQGGRALRSGPAGHALAEPMGGHRALVGGHRITVGLSPLRSLV